MVDKLSYLRPMLLAGDWDGPGDPDNPDLPDEPDPFEPIGPDRPPSFDQGGI